MGEAIHCLAFRPRYAGYRGHQGSGPMDMQELVDIAKRNLLFLLLLATLLVLNI